MCNQEFEVTRSSITGNGVGGMMTLSEKHHGTSVSPALLQAVAVCGGERGEAESVSDETAWNSHLPADSSTLPTAHFQECGPQGQSADFGTGADYKGSAPEISCGGVEGHAVIGEIARLDGFPILVEPIPSSAKSLNRSEYQASPAGTIRKGTTIIEMEQLVERIEATISPLQVAILDAEMRLIYRNRPMEDE